MDELRLRLRLRLRLGGAWGGSVPVATPDSLRSACIELHVGLGSDSLRSACIELHVGLESDSLRSACIELHVLIPQHHIHIPA